MSETFRILHCLRAPVGGLFRHVRDAAMAQAALGHGVGILCDSRSSDPLTEARLAEVAPHLKLGVHRVAMSREVGVADLTATATTRKIAEAVRADVLHGHGAKGGAYARLAARGMRRAGRHVLAFYTPHGGSLHYAPTSLKGRLFMGAERRLARHTDGIIFESAYAARVYREHVGEAPCSVRIIHNGLAAEELLDVPAAPDAADFVFVGELRLLKGVDLMIDALAAINRERPARAVIVGAGPDGEAFARRARAAGIEGMVVFAGAMPARAAFRLGRVLVMPSRAESLPYVMLEAAGAGLPLIATDVGGCGEIVAGTDTVLVQPGDAGRLARAMQIAMENPEAARQRANRLKAIIASRFTITAMCEGLLSLYGEASSERRAMGTPLAAAPASMA